MEEAINCEYWLPSESISSCNSAGSSSRRVRASQSSSISEVGLCNSTQSSGSLVLKVRDELADLGREEKLWMPRRKNQNMHPRLPELRLLLLHDPVGIQKYPEVDEDQPNRDDRPAASRHVLVLDWDEHVSLSLGRIPRYGQMPSGEGT